MKDQAFRALVLAHAGAVESSHMNHPDFRIGGKIFATLSGPSMEWGMVKLTPLQQKTFIDADDRAFQPASGSWGKQGCTMIRLRLAKKSLVMAAIKLAVENLDGSLDARKTKVAKRKMAKPKSSDVGSAIAALKRLATKKTLAGMARYGLPSENALGVSVGDIQKLAKQLGRDHKLAADLWATEIYEARMLATFVDDPKQVTAAQMDRWCKDFDSWGICDTVCFKLFDKTPHAWKKVQQWGRRQDEFVKRAAFALLASLVVHDKESDDEPFLDGLVLIEKAATDDRNFVKKGVNWALRCVGKRNLPLNAAATAVAKQLSESSDATARWVGKTALRDLAKPALLKRLKAKGNSKKP